MALRTLSFGLAALALSACNGGGSDCPVGQAPDAAGTCCPDADGDGVGTCTTECSPPLVTSEDGSECVCPTGTTDDGAGGCCTDSDADAVCDPDYTSPSFLGVISFFGVEQTGTGIEIRGYAVDNNGTPAPANPGFLLSFYDASGTGVGDELCHLYVEYDAVTNGGLANTTTMGSDTVALGMLLEFGGTGVSIANGDALGSPNYTSCNGVFDPAVYGDDFAASVASSGKSLGFAITGAMTSSDELYSVLQGAVQGTTGAGDWTTEWDPYVLSGSPFFPADGALPLYTVSQGGAGTTIGFGRMNVVDSTFLVDNTSFVAKDSAATSNGVVNGQAFLMPWTDSDSQTYFLP